MIDTKDAYFIINDGQGIFICMPELFLIEKNVKPEDIKYAVFNGSVIKLLDSKAQDITDIEINEEHLEVVVDYLRKKECALTVMDIKGKPIALLDVI